MQKVKRIGEFIKKNLKWILLFLCTIIFLDLVEDVFEKEIMKLDIITYNFISTYLISDFVTPIAKIITNLGGAISLISITIILLVVLKNKKIGIAVMINLLIITVLNIILKNVVQRPRPNEFRLITETGYSFPSGHSMVSMAFYGFLIYLIYKLVKNSKIKWTLIISLSIIICTIGISRIYLGVHYASDVLAGFTISISYLVIYTSIIKRFIGESRKMRKMKKIRNSFKYAIEGIWTSFKTERNMKIHIFIMILVIIAGIILKINKSEWIICIILFAIVIGSELFNTSIETIVDMVMPEKNEKAKIAKDVSAGAVLVVAIGATIIGLVIFVPRILNILI